MNWNGRTLVITAWLLTAAAGSGWVYARVQEAREATVQAGFVACAVACAHSAPAASSMPETMR